MSLLTIASNVYYRLMATNTWRAFEALLSWSDEVRYETVRGKDPRLVVVFDKSEEFFRWKDWVVDSALPYCYIRTVDDRVIITVPVEPFFLSPLRRVNCRTKGRYNRNINNNTIIHSASITIG